MKSRYLAMALVSLFLASSPSYAQIFGQNFNVFVGYSNLQGEGLLNRNTPPALFDTGFFRNRTTLHGGIAEITGAYKGVGITGDVSFNRNRRSEDITGGRNAIDTDVTYFMLGPSFHYAGSHRLEPFARILAGGANTRFDVSNRTDLTLGSATTSFAVNSTSFAMAVGGGVDVRIGDGPYRVRLFQFDYTPIFLRDKSVDVLASVGALQPFRLSGQRQDNVRVSIGFVF